MPSSTFTYRCNMETSTLSHLPNNLKKNLTALAMLMATPGVTLWKRDLKVVNVVHHSIKVLVGILRQIEAKDDFNMKREKLGFKF